MTQENRRKKRIFPRASVRFQLNYSADGKEYQAKTADLGYGGALIGTLHPLPPGTEISIEIKDDTQRAVTTARVVRDYPNGMAIEFVKPSIDFLRSVIKMLAPYIEQDAWEKLKGGQVIYVDFQTGKKRLQTS